MVTIKQYDRLVMGEAVDNTLIKLCHRGNHEHREHCGIIAGRLGVASEAIEIPNISDDGMIFRFDPLAFNDELKKLDASSKELLAIFHTHPPNSLELSQIDLNNATLDVVYIVVSSIMEDADEYPHVGYKGWLIKDHKPELIQIIAPSKKSFLTGDNGKASGIEVKISAEGLEAIVNMMDVYSGSRRLRNENDDLSHRLRRQERRERSFRDGMIQGLGQMSNNNVSATGPTPSTMMQMMASLQGANRDNPDTIAEDEMDAEDELRDAGELICTGSDEASPFINPKAPLAHKHQYKWVSGTPDGMNLYECTIQDCNKNLTVNGEIAPKDDEKDDGEPVTDDEIKEVKEDDGKDRNPSGDGADQETPPEEGRLD